MKNIIQKIKINKYKNEFNKNALKQFENKEFIVAFTDNTWERAYHKDDLIRIIKKKNHKHISYIFDITDRFYISNDIIIEQAEEV